MNTKLVIGLLVILAIAALVWFFVIKPKRAAAATGASTTTDIATRAVSNPTSGDCFCNDYAGNGAPPSFTNVANHADCESKCGNRGVMAFVPNSFRIAVRGVR